MKAAGVGGAATTWQDRPLAEECREAVAMLERALQEPPGALSEDVDVAERVVARMRDRLIEVLREGPQAADAARQRAALDRVNAALSLIVGVEYPAAGIQRKVLEQARDALKEVLAEGLR